MALGLASSERWEKARVQPAAPLPGSAGGILSSNFLELLVLLPSAGDSSQRPTPKWGLEGLRIAQRTRGDNLVPIVPLTIARGGCE